MKAAIVAIFPHSRLDRVKKPAYSALVLGTLAGIGLWGHLTHWTFVSHHSEATSAPAAHASSVRKPEVVSPSGSSAAASTAARDAVASAGALNLTPARVEFATAQAALDLGIATAPVERRSVSKQVTATAVVTYEPSRQAQLSARVAGTLWRLEKQVGQTIRAGDVLAIIDASAVGQAKSDFLRSIADVELRKKAHDRLQSFAKGEVATKQVEEAATELRKARVDLFNSQQALISLGLSIKLNDWQGLSEGEIQRKIKFLGLPEELVAGLDPDSTTATLLPIYAPFDGVVIGHNLAKGEVVSPTQSHFQIADVSRMWIVLHVREHDADELQLGQPVTFSSGKVRIASSLSWMSTEVDEKTRTIEVRCEVENPEVTSNDGQATGKRLLRANLFGTGHIQIHENPEAVVVPTKAIQRSGQSQVVFVEVESRIFEARPVRLGTMTAEFTEIVDGLDLAWPVVIEGSHILKAELQRYAAVGSQ
jgi:membrane fusion protein, heavy metal efflux system